MKTLKEVMDAARVMYYARALHLLETTNLSLSEVARKAGISARTAWSLAKRHNIHRPVGRPKF